MKQILCFGDSNTWGLNPENWDRYTWEERWTGILQNKLGFDNARVIEEGLCGRTTIFEDLTRANRNGLKTLPSILETHSQLDAAIIMLGTNDCKIAYNASPEEIAWGVEQCVDVLLNTLPKERILLISPIHLGEQVWKEEFDPEFDKHSVQVSKHLKEAYQKVALKKGINFLAASDFVQPSEADQEHLSRESHKVLAQTIYERISDILYKEEAA